MTEEIRENDIMQKEPGSSEAATGADGAMENLPEAGLGEIEGPDSMAKKKPTSEWKEWLKDIVIALVIGILLLQFVKPTIVKEHSMEPTLHENDYLFLSKQAYTLFGDPEYGDIVVFHTDLTREDGQEKLLIKRIIGTEGDTVSITNGYVYLNGEQLPETFTLDGYTLSEMDEVTVPEGCVFAMGDNRQNSTDSRDSRVGFVEVDRILGKAVLKVYPFNEFGTLYGDLDRPTESDPE